MTKTPFASAAIVILGLLACSGEAAAAPIAPTAVAKPSFQMPGPQQVTFRRRYYREYAPYSYYAPPAVTYWAPPVYGYAAPPPVYYSPPVVYSPPIRQYYGPPVVYYATEFTDRGATPRITRAGSPAGLVRELRRS